jgi:hypothetical protein
MIYRAIKNGQIFPMICLPIIENIKVNPAVIKVIDSRMAPPIFRAAAYPLEGNCLGTDVLKIVYLRSVLPLFVLKELSFLTLMVRSSKEKAETSRGYTKVISMSSLDLEISLNSQVKSGVVNSSIFWIVKSNSDFSGRTRSPESVILI